MGFWDRVKKALGGGTPQPPAAVPSPPLNTSPPAPGTVQAASPVVSSIVIAPTSEPSIPVASSIFLKPTTRDAMLAEANDIRRTTGWMFFGRRDLIPPVSDPRTLLIDRGMAMQGFLTPERLAEMHTIGEEWDKHANRAHHIQVKAGQSADAAIEADRAARTEIKLRKKAEAKAKREAHAEGVAQRKATDIVFVGRGVSGRMHDRNSDREKLESAGVPVISTPAELAATLNITVPKLRWLAYHTDVASRIHYVQFEIPKKSGGTRTLSAPHKSLAAAQEWILANILARLPVEAAAHGFVPGRSTVTNAIPHCRRDIVLNVDLESFFPSIGFARVRHCFARMGYSGAVATLLALLCTECPRQKVNYAGTEYFVATGPRGLPQGACTSPAISNQIARRLDRRLIGLTTKLGWNYTRYADDLTLSGGPELAAKIGYVLARLRHICEGEGFTLNAKKTRAQRRNTRQTVTGIVVNDSPSIPRPMIRRIRSILHRARTEGLALQNREQRPNFNEWLEGMIAYISMVKPPVGKRFREEYDRLV